MLLLFFFLHFMGSVVVSGSVNVSIVLDVVSTSSTGSSVVDSTSVEEYSVVISSYSSLLFVVAIEKQPYNSEQIKMQII